MGVEHRHLAGNQYGFFALWHNKASEYHASPTEEQHTGNLIQQAFSKGQSRGIRVFGRYGCRWSAERQYFTFWQTPSFDALEQTMDDLEHAGDFKFAKSEHILGVRVPDEHMVSPELDRADITCADWPIGFFAIWRRTDSHYRANPEDRLASSKGVQEAFAHAQRAGTRMLGLYDCLWSTEWQYFTFWLLPSFGVLESTMDELEQAGDFWFASSRHLVGNLEPRFRFGWHLQPDKE